MKKLIVLMAPLLLLVACKKDYSVSRSVVIDAPNSVVWQQIEKFENWKNWSPWYAKDTTMVWTFEGEDGAIGSSYSWASEHSGSGTMKSTGIVKGEKMEYHTHFYEPWESETDGYLELEEVDGGTQVTWAFTGEMKFPMSLFFNMDKMVGPDFEYGLDLLKQQAENSKGMKALYDIKEIDFEGMNGLAIRDDITFDDMGDFFARSYGAIMATGVEVSGGYPSGLYYTWDEENSISNMAAIIPTAAKPDKIAEGMEYIELQPGKALAIDYYGDYPGSENAHRAINAHMEANQIEYLGPAIEIYVTDPETEPDASKWLTQIIYPVK